MANKSPQQLEHVFGTAYGKQARVQCGVLGYHIALFEVFEEPFDSGLQLVRRHAFRKTKENKWKSE
jgi:hypothetical protein